MNEAYFRCLFAEQMEVSVGAITADTRLREDLRATDHDVAVIVACVERDHGVAVDPHVAATLDRVDEWSAFLRGVLAEEAAYSA